MGLATMWRRYQTRRAMRRFASQLTNLRADILAAAMEPKPEPVDPMAREYALREAAEREKAKATR